MRDIQTKEDVFKIVDAFYAKLREDEMLGPIFNAQIKEWDKHLEKITGFWYQMIFQSRGHYYGNPIDVHVAVDKAAEYQITPKHFGQWLYYWINTIKDSFEGPLADQMISQARRMQTVLFIKIFENKPTK